MALPAGLRTLDFTDVPLDSRPPAHLLKPHSLMSARRGQGKGYPARVAQDGTRWCAFCNTTLDPAANVNACTPCADFRERHRKTGLLDYGNSIPVDLVDALFEREARLRDSVNILEERSNSYDDLSNEELDEIRRGAWQVLGVIRIIREYLA
jgi:hypothetical protein